jgi:hypothetical protein
MIILCLYFVAVIAIRPFIDTRNLLQELLFTFIHFLIFSLCLAYLDEPWGHSDAVAVINILFTVIFFFLLIFRSLVTTDHGTDNARFFVHRLFCGVVG